jgi:hypothetical protein
MGGMDNNISMHVFYFLSFKCRQMRKDCLARGSPYAVCFIKVALCLYGWDLWWTKWHWDRIFFKFLGFSIRAPYSISNMGDE